MSAHATALARLAGTLPHQDGVRPRSSAPGDDSQLSNERGLTPRHGYKPPAVPAHVYLLAEHLDACLAAGEDLLKSSFIWNGTREASAALRERIDLREAMARIRAIERALIARVLRAREHAGTLAQADADFRLIANLFVSGTNIIADAVAELADPTAERFDSGADTVAYLRSRAMIAPDAAAPVDASTVAVTEAFQVARRAPLGLLLDLVAQFLDTLDVRYDLFPAQQAADAA